MFVDDDGDGEGDAPLSLPLPFAAAVAAGELELVLALVLALEDFGGSSLFFEGADAGREVLRAAASERTTMSFLEKGVPFSFHQNA